MANLLLHYQALGIHTKDRTNSHESSNSQVYSLPDGCPLPEYVCVTTSHGIVQYIAERDIGRQFLVMSCLLLFV
jgi:hypothetical protein